MRASLVGVILALMLIVAFMAGRQTSTPPAAPPAGTLSVSAEAASAEARTIAVFRAARDSVVAITTSTRIVDPSPAARARRRSAPARGSCGTRRAMSSPMIT
ncbi:hypothetical protein [Limimaricola cinnabarinus]|uniref:hypothetical protein n=1 Tax=Limimaricola cinnabarinus TaxID=1125964 RepID=UPI001F2F27FE|nr:hypothetical protein [Limimaricola cinnabarinus]